MKHSFLFKKTMLWQSYRYGKMLTTRSPLAKPEHNKNAVVKTSQLLSIRPTDLTFITTSVDKGYYGPHLPNTLLVLSQRPELTRKMMVGCPNKSSGSLKLEGKSIWGLNVIGNLEYSFNIFPRKYHTYLYLEFSF